MPNDYIERNITIGMIASADFLREVDHIYRPELLQSQAAKTICGWCIRHFRKHNAAPNQDIQLVYSAYARRGLLDSDQQEDIEDILQDLSDDFAENQINVGVLTDEAIKYFAERAVILLADEIKVDALRGDYRSACAKIGGFLAPDKMVQANPDFFADDPERTRKIFEDVPEPIVEYSGKLGELLNEHMVRGGFVAFLGQEKIGKTWILMDIAFQAQRNSRKVAFFAAGDMSKSAMELRKYIYLSRRSDKIKYCGDLIVPVADCWKNQNGDCQHGPGMAPMAGKTRLKHWDKKNPIAEILKPIFYEFPGHITCRKCQGEADFIGAAWLKIREKCQPLTWKEGYEAERQFVKRVRGGGWNFAEYPADTLSPRMLEQQLEIWKSQGFLPDVVLVDYPDIMDVNEEDKRLDQRHRKNSIWKKLRAIAHKWHCLVVVVTQADADAYKKEWLELDNFSEDKRQYAHATAFFGLNQTDSEAEIGLFRINQLMVREGARGKKFATVLQRLEIGRPHLGSF